jgi:hypothetical protein
MINGAIESAVSKVESAILNQIAKSISFGSVFFFFKKKKITVYKCIKNCVLKSRQMGLLKNVLF